MKQIMKLKTLRLMALCAAITFVAGCQAFMGSYKYRYDTVQGDPLQTRIYTLDNGLKVYLSVNKNAPRIHTFIAVKAGSKHDPASHTGLAHYFEHMMFKGTGKFGTKNFQKEKVLLDQIEELFEVYGKTTDSKERKAIYARIDKLSNEAANYAIPNEYDKMVAAIGAKGTNAYTGQERTVYVNDIPSNQLKKWLTLEAERFHNPVLRLFHTELETVYEEKNISLDNSQRKVWTAMNAALFKKHQYGTQTTIGTIEHLKNPSIRKVAEFYRKHYVAGNMAICLSGDLDPTETIRMIDETFGRFPATKAPDFTVAKEEPITSPVECEVVSKDAEVVRLAYRFDAPTNADNDLLTMIDMLLTNGYTGFFDKNLNQPQKVMHAFSFPYIQADYTSLQFGAMPKPGQSLEEAKALLLKQIENLKQGNFEPWVMEATINQLRYRTMQQYDTNKGRASEMVDSFCLGVKWEDQVKHIDRLARLTKEDVIDFAGKHFRDNYVVVYKRQGEDKKVIKVEKPAITPIPINRKDQSQFATTLIKTPADKMAPSFVNFKKDMNKFTVDNKLSVCRVENRENDLFTLDFIWDIGHSHDKRLKLIPAYMEFLGTSKRSLAEFQEELYKIACSFKMNCSSREFSIKLTGLNQNLPQALALLEELLTSPKVDQRAFDNVIANLLKQRSDDKLDKKKIFWKALYHYGKYGTNSAFTNIIGNDELKQLKPEQVLKAFDKMRNCRHQVFYYGPYGEDKLRNELAAHHQIPQQWAKTPTAREFVEQPTDSNRILLVDHPMQQVEILMLSRKEKFNASNTAERKIFNEYFGGGMSSVVFQTIREAKALAYSCFSNYSTPWRQELHHYVMGYLGTQTDKLPEAMSTMMSLYTTLPESQAAFNNCKNSLLKQIQTERITKGDILTAYRDAQLKGIDRDLRADIYKSLPAMSFTNVRDFHSRNLKDNNYTILVLGDKKKLDLAELAKYGKISYVTLEEIFGY